MKPIHVLVAACISVLLIAPVLMRPSEFSPPSRTFLFTYQVTLKAIPDGARRVRIWIPRPASDAHQTVHLKEVHAPVHLRETREEGFGNYMLYGEMLQPSRGAAEFTLEYEVTRREFSKGSFESLVKADREDSATPPASVARWLDAVQLVPVSGKVRDIADENTRGMHDPVEKAHALYDFVFHTVRYDKSGSGWGRGDSLWVCDSKHGNCTDFHSLFMSLARAEGIPARFEIGFPLPAGAAEGVIPGYHCWSEFFVNGLGWVPVDISEAWKDPSKHDYFFGSLDANRVQFTVGRDLMLQPRQDGPPLNYFVYPYVEVDGRPFDGAEKKFSFHEVQARG